jgi:hypothetical protein
MRNLWCNALKGALLPVGFRIFYLSFRWESNREKQMATEVVAGRMRRVVLDVVDNPRVSTP